MFESIGRDPDTDAGRRRKVALGLTLASIGLVAALVVGATALWARPPAAPTLAPELPWILVENVAEPDDPEPPPPPVRGGGRRLGDDVDAPPQPPTLPPEAPGPGPVPDDPEGPGGAPDGSCLNPPCGGEGDAPEGEGDGDDRSAGRHDLPPHVRRRTDPDYPKAARQASLGDQRCVARVRIDEDGVPYDVTVDGCPRVFHDATRDALMSWRWYPARRGKERVPAQLTVGVTYTMR